MRNKFHNQISIINYISSTERFKVLFVMGLFMAIYGSSILGISSNNYINSSFIAFQFPIFNIIFFSLIFYNTYNTYNVFEKKMHFYIIRLKNKNNYIKEIIKTIFLVNLYYIVLFLIMYFAFMLIFKGFNFEINSYKNYNISNLLYLIFYLCRYSLLATLLSLIFALFLVNYQSLISACISLLFLTGFIIFSITLTPKNYIDLNIWKFFSQETFSNFSVDITSSLLVIFLLQVLIFFLYKIALKKRMMIS